MPGRLDRVEVRTPWGAVTLTWDARDALVEQLRDLESLRPILDDFVNAGASRPVRIHEEQGDAVAAVLETGEDSREGLFGLEGGLLELRNALRNQ